MRPQRDKNDLQNRPAYKLHADDSSKRSYKPVKTRCPTRTYILKLTLTTIEYCINPLSTEQTQTENEWVTEKRLFKPNPTHSIAKQYRAFKSLFQVPVSAFCSRALADNILWGIAVVIVSFPHPCLTPFIPSSQETLMMLRTQNVYVRRSVTWHSVHL